MTLALLASLLLQDAKAWEERLPPHLVRRMPDLPAKLAAREEDPGPLVASLFRDNGICACPALLTVLLESKSPEARRVTCDSVGWALREHVARYIDLLSRFEDPCQVSDRLAGLLRDEDLDSVRTRLIEPAKPHLRIIAVRLLRSLESSPRDRLLANLLQDEDADVRCEAAGVVRDADLLVAAVRDKALKVSLAAAKRLISIGRRREGGEGLLRLAGRDDHNALHAGLALVAAAPDLLDDALTQALLKRARATLGNPGANGRREAARFLLARGSPEDRTLLREYAQSDYDYELDWELKRGADERPIDAAELKGILGRRMSSREFLTRGYAERLFYTKDVAPLLEVCLAAIGDRKKRATAVEFLRALGDRLTPDDRPRVLKALHEILADPYSPGYETSCELALDLGDREAAILVASALDRRPSGEALALLCRFKPPEALETLRKFCREAEREIQRLGIRGLAAYGHEEAADRALDWIEKYGKQDTLGSPPVLRPSHHARVRTLLEHAKEEWTIRELLYMLAPIATGADADVVARHTSSEHHKVRIAAGLVGLRIGVPAARRALLDAVLSKDAYEEDFDCIERALGKRGGAEYVELLESDAMLVRERAAAACAAHGVRSAAPALERLVRTDLMTAGEALWALVQLRGSDALPLVREVEPRGIDPTSVIHALAAIGTVEDARRLVHRGGEWLLAVDPIIHRKEWESRRDVSGKDVETVGGLADELAKWTGAEWTISPKVDARSTRWERTFAGPTVGAAVVHVLCRWKDVVAIIDGGRGRLVTQAESVEYFNEALKSPK